MMAQRSKRRMPDNEEVSPAEAAIKKPTRKMRTSAQPVQALPSPGDPHEDSEVEDPGREESQMMLSVIKPRTSSSNRDPWVTACKARIKSNEAELLELLDEKQQEAAEHAERYKEEIRSLIVSILPAAAPTAKTTQARNKQLDKAEDVLDKTSHALHIYTTHLLSTCTTLLETYRTATAQIVDLSLPEDPEARIAADRTKLAKVLEAGKKVAEKEIQMLMGGKAGDAAIKGMVETKLVDDYDHDEDAVLFRQLLGSEQDNDRVEIIAGAGVGDLLKDVEKGVGRMVRKMPEELETEA